MEKSKTKNLSPLRYIMIARDLNQTKMAEYFLCTDAYIGAVISEKKVMHPRTLKFGLKNMGIELDNYMELVELKQILVESDYSQDLKHRCMLIKAIEVINPTLRETTSKLLESCLNNQKQSKR